MRKGSGLANWEIFSTALLAVMNKYRAEHGRNPGRRVLIRLGYQNLVSAAYHHHGGLRASRQRLDLNEADEPSRTAHLEPGVGQGRKPGALADHATFQAALSQAISDYRRKHRRYPVQDDLIAAGHRSIVQAAFRHHDGLRQEFRKLGIPKQPMRPRKKRGFALWSNFEQVARPIWQRSLEFRGHLPSKRELFAMGHGRLVYAAIKHHGGLRKVHRRLGYADKHFKVYGRCRPAQWNAQRWSDAIREHFPAQYAWGFAPQWEEAKRINHGFAGSVIRLKGKWPTLVKLCGLWLHRPGLHAQRQVEVATWAITYYEECRHWPPPASGPHLQRVGRPRRWETWEEWLLHLHVPNPAFRHLRDRLLKHREWLRANDRRQHEALHRVINTIIIRANGQP